MPVSPTTADPASADPGDVPSTQPTGSPAPQAIASAASPRRASDISATLGVARGGATAWTRWRSRVAWLAVLAAIAGGIGWWKLQPPPTIAYLQDAASIARIRATITATGTLQPVDKVTVGAEVSGRVDEILVDFNDRVRKGDVLARLNTDELAARAVQARAGVAQARANLAKAQHDFRRAQELQPRGFVSREQYEQVRTTLDVARASFDNARAIADQAEANLAKAAIRSPIDGMVLDRKVERGQTVASSFQTPELFVIASDLTRLELTVDIDEADIGGVRVGQAARFEVDAYASRSFTATLAELRNAARTVANVVTYQGVLAVDNVEGLLKPGMTATADIEVRVVEGAVSVANRALRFTPDAGGKPSGGGSPPATRTAAGDASRLPALEPGTGRVWTLDAEGKPVPRIVRLGITDGTRTQILGGNVRPGERFVVDIDGSPRAAERGRGVRIRL